MNEIQNEQKKKDKIIITLSVIIIFALVICFIVLFLFTHRNLNEANNFETNSAIEENTINEDILKKMTKTNETIIDNPNETLDKSYGKVEVVFVDNNNNIIDKPNAPKKGSLTPIKFNNQKNVFEKYDETKENKKNNKKQKEQVEVSMGGVTRGVTDQEQEYWYNYANREWANGIDNNGNYFVWIPRFAYKITYYSDRYYNTKIGYSDSRGILKINQDGTLTRISSPGVGTKDIGNYYILAPAFSKDTSSGFKNGGWDLDIDGFWIAKFETGIEASTNLQSKNTKINDNIKQVSKPGANIWNEISVGNAYYNAFNFNREMESHLIKNSEWSATALLSYSQFGTDTELVTSDNQNEISGGDKRDTEVFGYKTNLSSNKNATGVYDMVRKCMGIYIKLYK